MASWKKVIVSGSNANLTLLSVDNLTSGQVVIGGGSGSNLTTTAINGTGTIVATTGASGLSHSGSFSGSFQGTISGGNSFIQDGNSFGTTAVLGTNDNQSLQFETSGSVRMVVSSSGEVGIGTTTPRVALDVADGTIFSGEIWTTQGFFLGDLNAGASYAYLSGNGASSTNSYLDLSTNVQSRLRITHAGNVGIGTTTPTASLHINNTSSINSFLVEDSTNPDATPFVIDSAGDVSIGSTSSYAPYGTIAKSKLDINAGSTGVPLTIRRDDATGDHMAFVKNDTGAKWWVALTNDDFRLYNLTGSDNILFGVDGSTNDRGNKVGIGVGVPTARLHVNNTSTSASFLVEDSANPDATPFIITNTGDVGIGTLTPRRELDVDGIIYCNEIWNTQGYFLGDMDAGASNVYLTGDGASSTNSYLDLATNASTKLRITHAGNVGIGTLTPNARLDVNGNAIITGSLTVTGTITGSIIAANVFGPYGGSSVISSSYAVNAGKVNNALTAGKGITSFTYDGSSPVSIQVTGSNTLTTNVITKWTGTAFADTSLIDNYTTVTGASSIQLTGANSSLTGSFTGSFIGNGSGLTGLATTLSISGSLYAGHPVPTSGSVSLISQGLTIQGTSNEIEAVVSGQTVTIGLPNDVAILNQLTVGGDLIVNGTTTTVNTADLLIEDKFILLASGSINSTDSGIIIDRGAYSNQNVAFGYDADTVRWGLQSNVTDSTSTMTIGTNGDSAFVGTVFTEAAHTSTKPTTGEFVVAGAIYTNTDGTIWMYA